MASDASDSRELAKLLSDHGLDAEYWAKILKKELNITAVKQLKYVDEKDKKKILKKRNHDWELKAWMAIDDRLTNPATFQERPDDESDPDGENGIHPTLIGKFKAMDLLNTIVPEKWSSKDLVERASGGSLMNGVLWSNSSVRETEQVVEIPSGIKTLTSSMQGGNRIIEFENKRNYDGFQQHLHDMGYTVAENLTRSTMEIFNYNQEREPVTEPVRKPKVAPRERVIYMARVMSCLVPLAAVKITRSQLSLTKEVRYQLQEIEQLAFDGCELTVLYEKLDSFYQQFGSHVNTGLVHFGGIYQLAAIHDNKSTNDKAKIKELLVEKLESRLSATMSRNGVGAGVGAEETGQRNWRRENSLNEIAVVESAMGGPPAASSIHEWKQSIKDKAYWRVIDRGDMRKDFSGIWEIIPNHSKIFKYPKGLALLLKYEWHRRYNSTYGVHFKIDCEVSANEFVMMMTSGIVKKIQDMPSKKSEAVRRYTAQLKERFALCEECLVNPRCATESILELRELLKALPKEVKLPEIEELCHKIKTVLDIEYHSQVQCCYGNLTDLKEIKASPTLTGHFDGYPLSLQVVGNYLYCCCKDDSVITVLDLELNSSSLIVEIPDPYDVAQINDTEIVVASGSGLFSLTSNGLYTAKKTERAKGFYTGVCVYDGHVYATTLDDGGEHIVEVYQYSSKFPWQKRRFNWASRCPSQCNGKTSIWVNYEAIYTVCVDHEFIYTRSRDGKVSKLHNGKGGSICHGDSAGAVLVASSTEKSLSLIHGGNGSCQMVRLDCGFRPQAAVYANGHLYVAGYNTSDKRFKIHRYS